MPKAKPFPIGDEDEKTTTESQWEDEASTTVEQGDVAEKIRALGVETPRRTITNVTNTGATGLDESTVDDQHADPMLAVTPVPRDEVAQLVITQGNDLGQALAVQPGKTYTIGRGVDNDLVLTDIAVSRKHFEVRFEDGAWVIADRGSGNGTVVNGNIEDNPFMLAHGDLVEIGNTVFRFEQPNGVARRQPAFDADDEEMSTVAGKAMRTDPIEAATPLEQPLRPLTPPPPSRERPKTLPPPTPLRPMSPSGPPPMMYSPPQPQQMPATTLPMPQMANRPVLGPGAPTMLAPDALPMPPGMMPTTIPGQQPPRASQQRNQVYPVATDIPPHSVHAQMLKIAANAGRTDPSTAHVSPTPYSSMVMPQATPQSFHAPQLSRRVKYAIGAAGLSVLAAILTIAITKSGGAKSTTTAAGGSGSSRTIKIEPIKPPVTITEAAPPAPVPTAPTPAPTPAPAPAPAPAPKQEPKRTQIAQPQPRPEPEPRPEPKQEPKKEPPPKQEPAPKKEPKRTQIAQPQPRPEPEPRPEPKQEPKKEPPPKRVATADSGDARRASDSAYAAKKFNDAAQLLYAAAKNASDDEARQLRHRAETIDKFARSYSGGTAPAAPVTEQFEKLRSAETYDQALGNVFNADIDSRLAQVAPKAALTYTSQKQYENALKAVEKSESLGVSNGNTKIVRQTLDSNARELYNEAQKEADGNPRGAKDKLHTLLTFSDPKSAWFDKANKLLKQLDR